MSWNVNEEQAKPEERRGALMPKGKYEATVFEVNMDQNRDGEDVLNAQLRISGPTHENRRLFHNNMPWGPSAPNSSSWWKTKAYLAALGHPVTAGSYTPPSIAQQEGTPLTVGVAYQAYDAQERRSYNDGGKTKDEYDRIASIVNAGNVEQIPDPKNGGTKDRYTLSERISFLEVAGAGAKPGATSSSAGQTSSGSTAAGGEDPWA